MMRFEMSINNRKELAARLAELTGLESRYSGVPACVYYIGDYTVGRDGSVEVEEEKADRTVLNTLISEGMLAGDLIPEEPEEPEMEEPQAEGDTLTISFPTAAHTGSSLRNLIYLVYSRGPLINKALGTHFEVNVGLIEALRDDKCTVTPLALRQAVADYEDAHGASMTGIQITDEEISLLGIPFNTEAEDGDAERVKACTDLAELMNRMAITQKRIQAKTVNDANEKYAMRIWLVRMGMGGAEYKRTRAILMENLSGNGAFRTEAEAEKFKAKQKAKRDAKKAAAAQEETPL